MAYWHELAKGTGGWLFPHQEGSRVAVSFRGEDARKAPFRGHFLRYEGRGEVPSHWQLNPEGWFELHPQEPLLAFSMEEAKLKFSPMMPSVEDGSRDFEFDKKAYQPPAIPQLVKELEHHTYLAKARIVHYQDGLYQVEYQVYALNGPYFSASTPSLSTDFEFEWSIVSAEDSEGQTLKTVADDLTSAEEIATIELNTFVAQNAKFEKY